MKLYKGHTGKNVTKFFFSNRVISPWNNLKNNVVQSLSIDSFKRNLSRAMLYNFVKVYKF